MHSPLRTLLVHRVPQDKILLTCSSFLVLVSVWIFLLPHVSSPLETMNAPFSFSLFLHMVFFTLSLKLLIEVEHLRHGYFLPLSSLESLLPSLTVKEDVWTYRTVHFSLRPHYNSFFSRLVMRADELALFIILPAKSPTDVSRISSLLSSRLLPHYPLRSLPPQPSSEEAGITLPLILPLNVPFELFVSLLNDIASLLAP